MSVDNRFRQYVKKEKYKPFVETTEMDHINMKSDVKDLMEICEKIQKNLHNDIHQSVRKATSHLRN